MPDESHGARYGKLSMCDGFEYKVTLEDCSETYFAGYVYGIMYIGNMYMVLINLNV